MTPFHAAYLKFGAVCLALLLLTLAVNYSSAATLDNSPPCRCDE